MRITHSKPGRPQGRGKKERAYRTIAEQFAVEVAIAGVDTLVELNRYFAAWVEQVYHRRVVRTTGQPPLERWLQGPSSLRATPEPDVLSQAFLWTVERTVTATRTVSLHGNLYEVDPTLVGRRIQLRYDPTDLSQITVWVADEPVGQATPAQLRAHVDPKLRSPLGAEPDPATGIRYLDALMADHADATRAEMTYQPRNHNHDEEPPR